MTLRDFTGPLRHHAGDVWHAVQDLYLRWRIKRQGGSYTDFYAVKMNRKAQRRGRTVNGRPEEKTFQLAFLQSQGLRSDTALLDYGCGAAAAGINFIRYLEPNCYTGADISQECIDLALAQVRHYGLEDKQPRFTHLPGGALDSLAGTTFDVVWAQSVFTHMPSHAIKSLLVQLPNLLRPKAVFYATFAPTSGTYRRGRVKNFYYNPDSLVAMAREAGFLCEIVEEWIHPLSQTDTMLRLTLPG